MKSFRKEQIVRLSLLLAILFSGAAMIPFVDLPVAAIGWEALAAVYAPELAVNESSGAPGSTFAFTGSGYPANNPATVYVNGVASGKVMTDAGGMVTFVLNTLGASPGLYNVTLEVDINASATQSVELVEGGSTVRPPAGFEGPTIFLGPVIYLPMIHRQ